MLTMRPPPCRSITLTAARQHRKTLVRSTSMTRCQSSSESSQIGNERPVIPALLTSTSRRPQAPSTRATAPSTSLARVTSPTSAKAPRPTPRAAVSTPSASWSSRATRAPSAARRVAMASPIPRAAPVTRAVLPATVIASRPAARRPSGRTAAAGPVPHVVERARRDQHARAGAGLVHGPLDGHDGLPLHHEDVLAGRDGHDRGLGALGLLQHLEEAPSVCVDIDQGGCHGRGSASVVLSRGSRQAWVRRL